MTSVDPPSMRAGPAGVGVGVGRPVVAGASCREAAVAADPLYVWQVPLPDAPAAVRAWQRLLTPGERTRAAGYGDLRRREFVVGRAALRAVLATYLAVPPQLVPLRTGLWGRPEVFGVPAPPRCTVSHSGDLVLLGVTAGREVGADVERYRVDRDPVPMATRYFPVAEGALVAATTGAARERAFLRLWTRKEAVVKAAGGRLAQGLRVPVRPGEEQPLVRDPSGRLPGCWRVGGLAVPTGYTASFAVAGARPVRAVPVAAPSVPD